MSAILKGPSLKCLNTTVIVHTIARMQLPKYVHTVHIPQAWAINSEHQAVRTGEGPPDLQSGNPILLFSKTIQGPSLSNPCQLLEKMVELAALNPPEGAKPSPASSHMQEHKMKMGPASRLVTG